jgi:hypothetical protein
MLESFGKQAAVRMAASLTKCAVDLMKQSETAQP